jgi:1,4-alpha-glucan branching enzyme
MSMVLSDPHTYLGVHEGVIRLLRPGAEQVFLEVDGKVVEALKKGEFFEAEAGGCYKIYHPCGLLAEDPYSFLPLIGQLDLHLFNQGVHYQIYRVLGAHVQVHQGVQGTGFAVWAPNASQVSLVADFNHWDGRFNPMRQLGSSGIFELFVPGIGEGEKYKFEIRTKEGTLRLKSDPFANSFEKRPGTASVVTKIETKGKRLACKEGAMSIYEVHLGSWRDYGSEFPNYKQIAPDLACYAKEMGFTHVELLPVMEHPLDESWGYQVSGFFAPSSRYGSLEDFQRFVEILHEAGVGVILDWVPAHFPLDDSYLNRFDGTALYEHEDPRKGIHPHWHTAIFNYGRNEVANFLIGSALFWLEEMGVDGLRVDAVASIVYLDYGRKAGEWVPNLYGHHLNLEGIEFLKHLTSIVGKLCPGALLIAEESSSFPGVTRREGLGFDGKWNMGWMNDTLRYMARDPIFRSHHQEELTFSLLYAFSEAFILVLSHDEVVHQKRSLLSKMPGPEWQQFANLRLLYAYQMAHPGKKLLFMGGELAEKREWNCKGHLDWGLLDKPLHRGIHELVKDLNRLYQTRKELHEFEDWRGYEWVDFSDKERGVISYLRKSSEGALLIVHHFTPETRVDTLIPFKGSVKEIWNSDDEKYGGSHQVKKPLSYEDRGFLMTLPPLGSVIFETTGVS